MWEPVSERYEIPGQNKGGYRHKCPKKSCGAVFASKPSVRSHINKVHFKKKLQCESCNWETYNPDSLQNHMLTKH